MISMRLQDYGGGSTSGGSSLGLIVLLAVIGTTIWVGIDASSHDSKTATGTSPGAWIGGCLILWIVFFPYYLVKRSAYGRALPASAGRPVPTPGYPYPHQSGSFPTSSATQALRSCPWCAELIQPAARICRFCNREVQQQPLADTADRTGSAPPGWYPTGQGDTRWWDGTAWADSITE